MTLKHRHIIYTYPYTIGERNGATRNLYEMSLRQLSQGIDVSIVAVNLPYDSGAEFAFAPLPPTDGQLQIQTLTPQPKRGVGQLVRDAVEAILRQKPADAILAHYHEAGRLPAVARQYDVIFGYVALWQSYRMAFDQTAKRNKGLRRFKARYRFWRDITQAHRQADVLFAISNFTRDELVDVLGVRPERVVVNYLGIGAGFHQIPRPEPQAINRLLFFGRLIETKGVTDAVAALALVAAAGNRDWLYRMMGPENRTGSHQTQAWLRGIIAAKGLSKQILVGDTSNDRELHQELGAAQLALMPSHAEAFGLSIAEAQAAGLPVVAYAVGAVPEVVLNGETGWLAPAHDVNALASCLTEALSNTEETHRRGLAARRHMAQMFSWEKNTATIVATLSRLQTR